MRKLDNDLRLTCRTPHGRNTPAYRVAAVRAGPLRQGQTVPFLVRLERFRQAPALAGLLFLLMSVLASGPAAAQGSVRKTFDDWQLRCETPAGAKAEQCALVQYLAAEDRPNLSLVVIVLKTADNRGYLLRVVAPLGVLLPSGLGLKIDQTDIGRAGFVRCLTTGCVAEVVMDNGLITQFKNGSKATFIVFQTPEEGVGIPLSMKGFANGFDSLK
jgi:invasion protein IalB